MHVSKMCIIACEEAHGWTTGSRDLEIKNGVRGQHAVGSRPLEKSRPGATHPEAEPRAPAAQTRDGAPCASYELLPQRFYRGTLYMQSMCGMKTLTGTTLHCNMIRGGVTPHFSHGPGFSKVKGANCRFRRGPVGVCVRS